MLGKSIDIFKLVPQAILLVTSLLANNSLIIAQTTSSQQIGLPYIQNFSPEDYHASTQNFAITQDEQGLIYAANGEGVLQYDGMSWRLIPIPDASYIFGVGIGSDNVVYVGGQGELGYLAPNEQCELYYVSLVEKIPEAFRDFTPIWKILGNGPYIFYLTDKYLFRWRVDGSDKEMQAWPLENIYHSCFVLNDKFYLWEWGKGLTTIEGDSLTLIPDGTTFANSTVRLIANLDKKGENNRDLLLIGTVQKGFFTYDGTKAEPFEIAPVIQQFLKENSLFNSTPLSDGNLALSTSMGGVAIMDQVGNLIQIIDKSKSLQDEVIYNVFVDREGSLWLALNEGVSRIEIPSQYTFFADALGLEGHSASVALHKGRLYSSGPNGFFQLSEPSEKDYRTHFKNMSTVNRYVGTIAAASLQSINGDLLAAAVNGILVIDDKSWDFQNLTSTAAEFLLPSRYNQNLVYVSTGKGIAMLKKTADGWKLIGKLAGITEIVKSIAEASPNELWVTSVGKVLQIQIIESNFLEIAGAEKEIGTTVKIYDSNNGLPEGPSYVYNIDNNIVFTTSAGFRHYDATSNRLVIDNTLNHTDTTRKIYPLNVQANGDIWFISSTESNAELIHLKRSGPGTYQQKSQHLDHILSDRTSIVAINADPSDPDIAWLSTSNGLIKYQPKVGKDYEQTFSALIRKVLINGDSLIFGGALAMPNTPEFAYTSNSIRFEYAAPNFDRPEGTQFQVWLKGFDTDWSEWTKEYKKDYTNLPEGNYSFQVRAKNVYGKISEEGNFAFFIAAPWYRSWWAYLAYLALIAGIVYGFIRWNGHRLRLRNQELETLILARTKLVESQKDRLIEQAEQLKALDQAKSQFFTNISHEFRTPLTVIAGMSDQIKNKPEEWLDKGTTLIKRNTKSLLDLINQILDLRKLESKEMELNLIQGDIIKYIKYIKESFESYAQSEVLQLHFLSSGRRVLMDYDPDKLLSIISNLLSNAIKYTPENGNIYISIQEENRTDISFLHIQIKDTGLGISEEALPHVFDRFYQVDGSTTRSADGTGIGLALTKELVDLLKGEIRVESTLGMGTSFSVYLPIKHTASLEEFAAVPNLDKKENSVGLDQIAVPTSVQDEEATEKPLLLIVEDNIDVTQYIISCLQESYKLEIAVNGQEGIDKALELVPDLIVSDVMMPEKDGFQLCDTLKQDERTSHIPIILLTAKVDFESKLSGLKKGADAYLTKPFQPEELLVRLENLFDLRQNLQKRYAQMTILIEELPEKVEAGIDLKIEDAFIQKIRDLIENNMMNTEYSQPQLCKDLNLSRSQLFRKVKALTSKSPSLFVRSIRLSKALTLLKTTDLNVSEVAYEVGFTSPVYFSNAFLEEFGKRPVEIRN